MLLPEQKMTQECQTRTMLMSYHMSYLFGVYLLLSHICAFDESFSPVCKLVLHILCPICAVKCCVKKISYQVLCCMTMLTVVSYLHGLSSMLYSPTRSTGSQIIVILASIFM